MNIKNNNQYRLTHKNIEEYVLSLLQAKKIQEITVTEICKALSINRSTFYAHFTDIMDVLEQTEKTKMQEIQSAFEQGLLSSKKDAFLAVFQYIADNREFYTIYLDQNKEIKFADSIVFDKNAAAKEITEGKLTFTDGEMDYFICFFRSGINALIKKWVSEGIQITPEELFGIMHKQFDIYKILN